MPHISQRKISEEDFKKIYNQLISVFDTAGNDRRNNEFLKEFFTPTEKMMFAKRLAILCMIDEDISKHYISEILLVSPSTVDRISLRHEQNKYPYLSKILKKNKETIWNVLEKIIRKGAEHRGKGRWKWFNEMERKHKHKTFKT